MTKQLLIAGAGMGGLAAAIAGQRAGWHARVFEQSPNFSEVGAGIQLGPNATRVLQTWDLEARLQAVAAYPQRLLARDAVTGAQLGELQLGATARKRYGAPYATVHRADLHGVLLQAARDCGAALQLAAGVGPVSHSADSVRVQAGKLGPVEGDVLIGADGLWSVVRGVVSEDGPPIASGHLAYRTLLRAQDLPPALRSADVTVWMGARLHAVSYPVRQGEWLNLVVIVQGTAPPDAQAWDHAGVAGDLRHALGQVCLPLRDLVECAPSWRLWVLHERPPLAGSAQMARGRVALLGDAAHPMRPYLAQGAGMAIEDALELGRCLRMVTDRLCDAPHALHSYALNRWERCAWVQRRSARNGRIFHATGALRWARDRSLALLGERLMDVPWLYRGPS